MLAVSSTKQKRREWESSTGYTIACDEVKQGWKLMSPIFRPVYGNSVAHTFIHR